MFIEFPTPTREIRRPISTGVLPRDDGDALDGDGDALDGDGDKVDQSMAKARALIEEEADKLRMLVDCASDDMDRQDRAAAKALIDDEADKADKARRLRALVDYASDDDDEDDQSNADAEPAVGNAADLYAIYAAYAEDDEEDGKDYGPHFRLHPDYQSYPANEPEDEDDDGGELEPKMPSPWRSPEVDERAGPSTNARHVHYDEEDDVIVIKAGQSYYASSSSGSGSPSGSSADRSSSPERFDDLDEQLARAEERRQQRLAAAMEKPNTPTPDADGIPHFASEDIEMSSVYTLGLELKTDDEILAGFFGEGHGAVLTDINPTPPPTSPGQNAPPAPTERMAIRPELVKRLEEVSRPRNLLHRTMNGDAYIPDGAGGFMSARTGRHVDRAFASDLVQRQEENTLRSLAQMIDSGQVVVTIVQDQPAPPSSAGSDDDAQSVEEQLGASVSDEEAIDAPTRKRTREEDEQDEASSEKRRRVSSEEQPGSRAVLRLRSRAPSPSPARNELGSSAAATQSTIQPFTAAAAAPHADGPAIVETPGRAADGSDETPTASTSVSPAAEPAQAPVPSRRSTRIRGVAEAARLRAADAARRAAEAAPVPKQRGKGKGKGKGRA